MKGWIAASAFVLALATSASAQQVIPKGSWVLEDSSAPFTIWHVYASSDQCVQDYPRMVAIVEEDEAKARSVMNAMLAANDAWQKKADAGQVTYSAPYYSPPLPYTSDKTEQALANLYAFNNILEEMSGAICVQQ